MLGNHPRGLRWIQVTFLLALCWVAPSHAEKPNWYAEGIRAERAGNYGLAIEYYERAADEGLSIAGFASGRVYRDGLGDMAASFDAFLSAAKQGNAFAQYEVGVMYLSGHGVAESSVVEARRWLELAAVRGRLAEASLRLFEISNTDADRRKWLKLAAEWGSVEAMNVLAGSYERGAFGFRRDEHNSAEWQAAADAANEYSEERQ